MTTFSPASLRAFQQSPAGVEYAKLEERRAIYADGARRASKQVAYLTTLRAELATRSGAYLGGIDAELRAARLRLHECKETAALAAEAAALCMEPA